MMGFLFFSPYSLALHLPWPPAGKHAGTVCVCGQHAAAAAAGDSLAGNLCRAEQRSTGKTNLVVGKEGFIYLL